MQGCTFYEHLTDLNISQEGVHEDVVGETPMPLAQYPLTVGKKDEAIPG